jgi:hypothetical protein
VASSECGHRRGKITPGEAGRIARVYESFVRTAGTVREKGAGAGLLQILTADDVGDDDEDTAEGEDIDDRDP